MNNNSAVDSHVDSARYYRPGRRRWVPKGVMLLAVLFVVGLLGACVNTHSLVAEIAVPVEQSTDKSGLDHRGQCADSAVYAPVLTLAFSDNHGRVTHNAF